MTDTVEMSVTAEITAIAEIPAEDPNLVAKRLIMFGVGEIPAVGKVLEVFLDLFWPEGDKPDPWEVIKERVEALINAKLSEDAESRMKAALQGLKTNLQRYTQEMQGDGSAEHKFAAYETLRGIFDLELPSFKQEGQKAILLPLFVQAANLHLSFLRDAHNNRANLGFSPGEAAQITQSLKTAVGEHTAYVKNTAWTEFHLDLDHHGALLTTYASANSFTRNMTLDLDDYLILWKYFDPDHPAPDKTPLTREIYSDCLGSIWPPESNRGIPGDEGYPNTPGYYPRPRRTRKLPR
jgi:hypothetical protein